MSFNRKICFLMLAGFALNFNFLLSQSYNFKNYSTADGLSQSQVLSIFQDSKGYIWFGTNSGGVSKFDGNKFEQLNINDGLISDGVYTIIETDNHEIVFGTFKGISVYKNFKFTNYSEKQGLGSSLVYKLVTDKNKVWIGTQEGVYILKNKKIVPFVLNETLKKSSIYSIFIDSQDNIWFGTIQNGTVFYNQKNKTFKEFNTSNGLMSNFVLSFAERTNGDVIIGTQTGLNIINKNFAIRAVTEIPSQNNICFSSITKSNTDEFYFGTFAEGVFSYNFTTKIRKGYYNNSNGLTNTPILSTLKDRENNIWIGTNGSGIYKFNSAKFTYYSKQNGFPENYINAVAKDAIGNTWVALNSNGLIKITKGILKSYVRENTKPYSLQDNNINCILPMPDSSVYIGADEGIYLFKNEKFNRLNDPLIANKYITYIFKDSKSKIWVGTNQGVYIIDGEKVSEDKKVNSLCKVDAGASVYFIKEDKFGRILIGVDQGLIQRDENTATLFTEKNKFINARASCAVMDNRKNIWIGTSNGLYLYNNNTFSRISKKNRYTSGYINFLEIDKNNKLYIGTNNGIDVLELNSFYKNDIRFKHLGKDDGLIDLESNINASFISNDNKLFVGTVSGLEIYDLNLEIPNTQESKLNITDVKLFFGLEEILDYSNGFDTINLLPKNLILPYSKNNLTFKYVGISLVSPEKIKYKYKLVGLDDAWTPEISKTEATYPSLPPGTYSFMVVSMNNDGLWNKSPAIFSFEILSPWYKTWWFYTLCGIALLSGIFTYNTIKTKKLKADKQKLEKQVDERTKEVVKQKEEIEHKNLEITDSIKYAKNIQEALLPSQTETEKSLEDCFILYLPKDIVSGDFFWHSNHNNIQFIAAADCTGHGVPGAFMSIVGNNLLEDIINQRDVSNPGEILLELHKGVKIALNQNSHESERRDGMDIALCAINKKTNSLEFSGANRPLWIFRKDKGYELEITKPNKFPIGGLEFEDKREYVSHHIEISKGDTIYIFSDGFADQFGGPKGKKFMLSNMQKLLKDNIENPLDVQKKNISNAFKSWKDSLEQIDDVLVIGIKI